MGIHVQFEQAHALDQTLSDLGITLEGVINIEVNPESLLERLSGLSSVVLVVQLTTKYLILQKLKELVITVKVMISTNVKMINQKRLNVVWMSILHKENLSLSLSFKRTRT